MIQRRKPFEKHIEEFLTVQTELTKCGKNYGAEVVSVEVKLVP